MCRLNASYHIKDECLLTLYTIKVSLLYECYSSKLNLKDSKVDRGKCIALAFHIRQQLKVLHKEENAIRRAGKGI